MLYGSEQADSPSVCQHKQLVRAFDADYVCDMGGELNVAYLDRDPSNREIYIDWLYRQPHQRMKAHVERFDLGGTHIFLLAKGSLLNLAGAAAAGGADLFDLYTAVMRRGISWLFDGGAEGAPPGVQPYPSDLEQEIARLWVKLRGEV